MQFSTLSPVLIQCDIREISVYARSGSVCLCVCVCTCVLVRAYMCMYVCMFVHVCVLTDAGAIWLYFGEVSFDKKCLQRSI